MVFVKSLDFELSLYCITAVLVLPELKISRF